MDFGPLARTRVKTRDEVATQLVRLTLEPAPGHLDAHVRAGQFCALRPLNDSASPFALLSAPHERELAFLVSAGGDSGRVVAALDVGDPIEASAPQGKGFDLERAVGRDLLLIATGSGIAPIRALLVTVLSRRAEFGALSLYYGVRSAAFVALAAEIERFRSSGVQVVVHYSSSAKGEKRYVQDALFGDGIDLARAAIFAAGQPDMVRAVSAGVRSMGGDPDWVISNL